MQNKCVLIWELLGVLFLVLVGPLFHFIFVWTGFLPIGGIFSSLNESVLDYLKLGFWVLMFFSIFEFWFIHYEKDSSRNNFILAKALGALAFQAVILTIVCSYTAFTSQAILVIDIFAYVLGCILCQFVSYKVLTNTINRRFLFWIGIVLLLIQALLLIVL